MVVSKATHILVLFTANNQQGDVYECGMEYRQGVIWYQ